MPRTRRKWSPEQRAKFKATMAARTEPKATRAPKRIGVYVKGRLIPHEMRTIRAWVPVRAGRLR